jgi:hypothetical protein
LRFEPRKKINGFEDPLIENIFWRFFRFVLRKFCLFWLFLPIQNTETNQKKCFLVSRNKPKNNRNRLSFGVFRFIPKKIDSVPLNFEKKSFWQYSLPARILYSLPSTPVTFSWIFPLRSQHLINRRCTYTAQTDNTVGVGASDKFENK